MTKLVKERYPESYYGVGPVCWETDGATCHVVLTIISADNSACPWYDKCDLTLKRGCSTCPSGYTNDGCTCRIPLSIIGKKNYGRTAGIPMTCTSDQDRSGALCYPPCPTTFDGEGPVCWQQCTTMDPGGCAEN